MNRALELSGITAKFTESLVGTQRDDDKSGLKGIYADTYRAYTII